MKGDLPSRFGPYEIIGPLGAGGMGEVYRARDTRLQRDVALKILPRSAASNPDRQRRFAQEAIAAGALNHPNILAVYDVGVEADASYIVSELIEGVALRREMDRGRLPLKRWLDLSVQIADGLAAAHEAGIVHRDIKPDNVMITRDGRVKILDFGLAKTTDGEGEDLVAPSAMTQTAAGLLVGTIPYMSPEQARGGRVDFRSDQFSLGLVLYEMATGIHPFLRESSVQTLSAIIADEPKPLAPLTAGCPAPLRWTIERLLAKDPHHRYASTLDLATDLRTIRDRLAEAAASTAIQPAPSRRVWLRRSAMAAMVLAAFVLGVSVPSKTADDITRYKFTPFATEAGYQGAPVWSPDGKTIAYVAEVDGVLQVFTKARGSSMRVQVTRQRSDCHEPFWSPDGRIYYHALAGARESLWRVSVAGGEAEMLQEGAARAAVSPDGGTLAMLIDATGTGVNMNLWVSSPPEAEPKPYSRVPYSDFADASLHYSPDGSKLLLWLMHATVRASEISAEATGFWIASPAGSELRPILPSLAGPSSPAFFSWLPDSRHIIVVRNDPGTPGSHLWLADTESDSTRPLTVTNGNEGFPAVAPDGKQIAFTSEATDFDLVLLPDDGSPPRPILSSTRNELDPAWSPRAAEYAFVTDRTGAPEIWLRSEEGNFERRLVAGSDFEGSQTIALGALSFSPDGRRLAYQRFATDGGYRIWVSPTNGGSPVRLTADEHYQDGPTWSPDGNWMAFNLGSPEQSLAKVPVGAPGTPPVILRQRTSSFTRPQWSPDGAWILAATEDGLGLISPDGKRTRTLDPDEWIAYTWSIDGSRIYGLLRTEDLHHFMLASIDVRTGEHRVVNANIGAIPKANQPIRGLSPLPKGGLATSIARARSDVWLLEGFTPPRSLWARFWRR